MEKRTKKLQLYLIFFTFLIITFSSIGFSALSSSLTVTGDLTYVVPETVVLTDVKLYGTTSGATNLTTPTHTDDSAKIIMNLSSTGSTITYQFTFVNNANYDMKISDFSSSATNLSYTITDGSIGSRIGAGETATLNITFECTKEGECPSSGVTNNLKFTYAKYNVSYLMVQPFKPENGAKIKYDEIESISFEKNNTPTSINYWDVSEDQDNSVIAWYTDTDSNGLYEVKIGSVDGVVYANPNSSYLFAAMSNLSTINFKNFNTSNVTSMRSMFSSVLSGEKISVSGGLITSSGEAELNGTDDLIVNPSSPSNNGCNKITTLSLSEFNTAKVNNMSYMFYECSNMTILTLPNNFYNGQVTESDGVFYGMSKSLIIGVYPDNTKSWILKCRNRPLWNDSNFHYVA